MVHPIWRLSETDENNLGLACNEEGLVLGRTLLIERREGRFVARDASDIQRLLSCAYRTEVDPTSLLDRLATVAAALNANDLLLARIAAVHLRIPDLPDQAARDALEAEDRLVKAVQGSLAAKNGDWDPAQHPRTGTAPNPGWFAPTEGASSEGSGATRVADNSNSPQPSDAAPEPPDDRVKLPPSDDDIDELHDFVEWIANAKPEDEAAIRAEIKKRFYDVGDISGGNALNRALSDALEAGNNKKARQEILDNIADFAKADPAVIGFLRELAPGILALPRAAIAGTEREATAAAEAEAAAAAAGENPWKMGWGARGKFFDKVFGKGTLNPLSRTIDDFEAGIALSRKSIDLNAATYQDFGRLTSRLDAYIDKLAEYTGTRWGGDVIESSDIKGRVLQVIIPKGSMSPVQRAAIEAARERAKRAGINLTIMEF
jgi:CDI toxin restriction endonuclease-like domain